MNLGKIGTGIDMSQFHGNRKKKNEPPMTVTAAQTVNLAAKFFQEEGKREKVRIQSDEEIQIEREFGDLQTQMDSRMQSIEDFVDFTEKHAPASDILENVMADVEQDNVQIEAALQASEKRRRELEQQMREQNKELTDLRASTVVLKTLEEEASMLTENRLRDQETLLQLNEELAHSKNQEHQYMRHLEECERNKEHTEKEHREQCLNMSAKLRDEEEELEEKMLSIESAEQSVKELLAKCEQLQQSNEDIKGELNASLDSGKYLMHQNTKLHFCKNYLEKQIDQLIKETQNQMAHQKTLKLKMQFVSSEKLEAEKELKLLRQSQAHVDTDLKDTREVDKNLSKQLKSFERGDLKSAVVVSEINHLRDAHETERNAAQKAVRCSEDRVKEIADELKLSELQTKRLKSECIQLQCRLDYFNEGFLDKQELAKYRLELEQKFKLDVEQQVQSIGQIYERERIDLTQTVRDSLNYRRGADDDFSTTVEPPLKLKDYPDPKTSGKKRSDARRGTMYVRADAMPAGASARRNTMYVRADNTDGFTQQDGPNVQRQLNLLNMHQ